MSKKRKGSSGAESAVRLLERLNQNYLKIHTNYENLYWKSHMGDHSVDGRFSKAQLAREAFRSNESFSASVREALVGAKNPEKKKLEQWAWFFSKYQTLPQVKQIFEQIVKLEKVIQQKQSSQKEGYIDPRTKKFISMSRAQMGDLVGTNDEETVRKACFVALEKLALTCTAEYIKLVKLRNLYAVALKFTDFYEYKIRTEESMSKTELFEIFDTIYNKTKYAFKDLRQMEKEKPGLRLPWNRGYLLAGDFTKEADQYFPFEEALARWGTSFMRLGIDFKNGTLQLDLLDRKGKYDNGFCHWPSLVYFRSGKRVPGASNFTCNVVYGQVGSAEEGYNTLFHEGGHAAHLLNTEETEACVNNEYPPASTAWAETQSMFLDTILSSIEWTTRYAKNHQGEAYPFDLFEREVRRLNKLSPLSMNGISSVMEFERRVYEEEKLTKAKLLKIAKDVHRKYSDTAVTSVRLLSVPHIYSWESACSYQGYGLAELALSQWREYFFKKYGYIVDNPNVGKELRKMWAYGSALTFPECVKLATGKKLTPQPFLKAITSKTPTVLKKAKQKIARLSKLKATQRPVQLRANIKMVDGKKVIAGNENGFKNMTRLYAKWLQTKRVKGAAS